eukprot:5554054-Amphidinium_carterae.1
MHQISPPRPSRFHYQWRQQIASCSYSMIKNWNDNSDRNNCPLRNNYIVYTHYEQQQKQHRSL